MVKLWKPGKLARLCRERIPTAAVSLALLGFLGSSGCTRNYFRKDADKEVDCVLHEKDIDPNLQLAQYHIYPDGRARFADPTNADFPPMPPDDPWVRDLAPNPQKPGKSGVALVEGRGYLTELEQWTAINRAAAELEAKKNEAEAGTKPKTDKDKPAETEPARSTNVTLVAASKPGSPTSLVAAKKAAVIPFVEFKPAKGTPEAVVKTNPPAGEGALAASSTGNAKDEKKTKPKKYLINLDQSVELGCFNSREFQDERENLYLTALPVTLQRFSFAGQYVAASELYRQWSGSGSPTGDHNIAGSVTNTGFSKLLSTGGLLLLNFANSTVVDFANSPRVVSQTTANLDFIQPLLSGAGKAVTLEPLTQTERNLLYKIREYVRFRKVFYVSVAGGGGSSINGGAFVPQGVVTTTTVPVGSGLGNSGLTPGIAPPVQLQGTQPQQLPGTAGVLNLAPALPPSAPGYFGTVLQYVQIAVDQENIEALERFLNLFKAIKEGGDISQLQVDLVEQQLVSGKSQKLQDVQQYETALDQFRLQLGIPDDLPLELDDSVMRPLVQQFRRYEQLFRQYDLALSSAAQLGGTDPTKLRDELRRVVKDAALTNGTRFQEEFPKRLSEWEKLSAEQIKMRVARIREERRLLLDRQVDLEKAGKMLSKEEEDKLTKFDSDEDLSNVEMALREYAEQSWKKETSAERRKQMQTTQFRNVINLFNLLLGEARNQRLETIRNQWPPLPKACVDGIDLINGDEDDSFTAASRAALFNRLDLLNARAQLVDAWRQIAVYANALLGTANVQYHLGLNSPLGQSQPFAIGGNGYTNQLSLDTQLPLCAKASAIITAPRSSLISGNGAH